MTDHPGHASALYSVALAGEVDDREQLVELEDAFRSGEAIDLVVDVADVRYLGDAGLETLAVLCADAAERGGVVTVVRATEQVAKAIQASGLDRLLILADAPHHR